MVLKPLDYLNYGKELPVLISAHVLHLDLQTIAVSFKNRIGEVFFFWYRLRTFFRKFMHPRSSRYGFILTILSNDFLEIVQRQ
jgi:hypothetical protein